MRGNQMIVEVKGYDSRSKAAQLIGKRVLWLSPAKKEIHGKIVDVHGNSGAVRARFNRGMPGQAIGAKVELSDSKKVPKSAKKPEPKKPAKKPEETPKPTDAKAPSKPASDANPKA